MSVDSDLLGVIVACTVVGVCLCIIVVISAVLCFRRLENQRRKERKKRMNGSMSSQTWSNYPPPVLGPAVATSDMNLTFDQGTKIGNYVPKILTPAGSAIYNTASSRGKPPSENLSNGRPSPNHVISPMTNGHVWIPVSSLTQPHYLTDFYDARMPPGQMMAQTYDPRYVIDPILLSDGLNQYTENVQQTASENSQEGDTGQVDECIGDQQQHQQQLHQQQQQSEQHQRSQETPPSHPQDHDKDIIIDKETQPEIHTILIDKMETRQVVHTNNGDVIIPPKQVVHTDNGDVIINHKAIKKQHNHAKMPEWMVKEYEEAEHSIDVEEEDLGTGLGVNMKLTPFQQQEGTDVVSVMVQGYSVTGEGHTEAINNNKTSKAFTILDYIDPPTPLTQRHQITTTATSTTATTNTSWKDNSSISNKNDNLINDSAKRVVFHVATDETETESKSNDKAPGAVHSDVQENKAAVLRQIRERVNESADQTSPVFTSTPRVMEPAPEVNS